MGIMSYILTVDFFNCCEGGFSVFLSANSQTNKKASVVLKGFFTLEKISIWHIKQVSQTN